MARVLRMPGVSADADDVVLAEWLVAEATDFAAADALVTVETDKAAVEVEAETAGRVLKVLVPPGAQVLVGDPIAVLGDPGEQVDDLDALLASLGVSVATSVTVPERRDIPERRDEPERPPPPEPPNSRLFTSPLARKIAKSHGLAIEQLTGTGPRGRILRRDVDAAIARSANPEPAMATSARPTTPPTAPGAAYEDIPHSRMRLTIARRLSESKQQAPHFYLRATIRAEPLLALRAELNDSAETRVSINDLVVKAVAAAHRRVPEMNVTWTPDAVRRHASIDIAVAVATDRGLLTPVVRGADRLSVTALSTQVRDLADRARTGLLTQDELDGGAIAVTNLGMFGVEEFAAIINPPQAAILAVGAVRDEPVVEAGTVLPGKVVTVTLSVDHRPVDGALAARWLATLTELLEHPVRALA